MSHVQIAGLVDNGVELHAFARRDYSCRDDQPLINDEEDEAVEEGDGRAAGVLVATDADQPTGLLLENDATSAIDQNADVRASPARGKTRWRGLLLNASLTIGTAISQVGTSATLPIFQSSLENHIVCGKAVKLGSNYFTLFFSTAVYTLLFGMCVVILRLKDRTMSLRCPVSRRMALAFLTLNSLAALLVIYSSPPDRTPPFIQPLLSTALVPMAVVARYLILRKRISAAQKICAFAAVIGVLIAMEPVMFNIGGRAQSVKTSKTHQAIWSCVFFFSFLPFAVMNVLEEKALKDKTERDGTATDGAHPLVLTFWITLLTLVGTGLLFFSDFIPWFGQAEGFSDFSSSMASGFRCMIGKAPSPQSFSHCHGYLNQTNDVSSFNPDPSCSTPIGRFWLQAMLFCMSTFAFILLIKYSQGAIYAILVFVLNAPLGALFWVLFELNSKGQFSWKPTIDDSTAYILSGLCITVPAVAIYNVLDYRDQRKGDKKKKKSRENETEMFVLSSPAGDL